MRVQSSIVSMNTEAEDILVERPVVATAVVAAVAAVAYAGIQLALGDAVAPVETVLFVVVFTVVYVAGSRYRRRARDGAETSQTGDDPVE